MLMQVVRTGLKRNWIISERRPCEHAWQEQALPPGQPQVSLTVMLYLQFRSQILLALPQTEVGVNVTIEW